MARSKRLWTYIISVVLINYLVIGVYALLGGKWSGIPGTIMGIVYMFIPMTVSLILYRFVLKESIMDNLGINFSVNLWFLAAWLIMPVAVFICIGITMFMPNVTFTPDMAGMFDKYAALLEPEQLEQMREQMTNLPIHPLWFGLIQGLIAGLTINALVGFGEELGWRGYMFRELKHMNFWKASLITGAVWGIWHAPVILMGHNYPSYPVLGVFLMIAWCLLLSPLFHWIRLKTKSVIASAIMHGTLNGTVGLTFILFKADNDLMYGLLGLPGFITLILMNIVLFFIVRRDKSLQMETEVITEQN